MELIIHILQLSKYLFDVKYFTTINLFFTTNILHLIALIYMHSICLLLYKTYAFVIIFNIIIDINFKFNRNTFTKKLYYFYYNSFFAYNIIT